MQPTRSSQRAAVHVVLATVVAGLALLALLVAERHVPDPHGNDTCAAISRFARADVPLDEPLGTRRVESLGHVVPRRPPP